MSVVITRRRRRSPRRIRPPFARCDRLPARYPRGRPRAARRWRARSRPAARARVPGCRRPNRGAARRAHSRRPPPVPGAGQIGWQALPPERAQQQIGEAGAGAHQRLDRLLLGEPRPELLLGLAQQCAAALAAPCVSASTAGRRLSSGQSSAAAVSSGASSSTEDRLRPWRVRKQMHVQCAARGLKVSTSCPSASRAPCAPTAPRGSDPW